MSFIKKIKNFIAELFFNARWRCNVCGKEIFDGKYFCQECESKLPFNDGIICAHCGRKTIAPESYCSTCKEKLVALDKCRSAFVYDGEIAKLIKKAKFGGKRYILEIFSSYLSNCYFKHYFNSDVIVYVPMTKKALRKRGYNQSQILAQLVSDKVGVPTVDCIEKIKDTKRQATLDRAQRLKNLEGAFKITSRSMIKDKSVLIIDDVTTTGSTAEVIAERLKRAGASIVNLLTVASVPPKAGY